LFYLNFKRIKVRTAVKDIIIPDQIEALDFIYGQLDTAVLAAYSWHYTLTHTAIM
jgi:hypothetical protein